MTYQTLNDVIKRLAEKSRVPAEQMQQFEVATGMRGQRETVMLCGLMLTGEDVAHLHTMITGAGLEQRRVFYGLKTYIEDEYKDQITKKQ